MNAIDADPVQPINQKNEALGAGDLARRLLQLDPNTVVSWLENDESSETVIVNGIADVLDSGEIVNSRTLNVLSYDEFHSDYSDEPDAANALYEEGNAP